MKNKIIENHRLFSESIFKQMHRCKSNDRRHYYLNILYQFICSKPLNVAKLPVPDVYDNNKKSWEPKTKYTRVRSER